jgi:hypothetical protein
MSMSLFVGAGAGLYKTGSLISNMITYGKISKFKINFTAT